MNARQFIRNPPDGNLYSKYCRHYARRRSVKYWYGINMLLQCTRRVNNKIHLYIDFHIGIFYPLSCINFHLVEEKSGPVQVRLPGIWILGRLIPLGLGFQLELLPSANDSTITIGLFSFSVLVEGSSCSVPPFLHSFQTCSDWTGPSNYLKKSESRIRLGWDACA